MRLGAGISVVALACLSATNPGNAQAVRAAAPTWVAKRDGSLPSQVWVSADPTDGDHLLACTFGRNPFTNVAYSTAYVTFDGGKNWQQTLADSSSHWVSETSCALGPDSAAYLADGASKVVGGDPQHWLGDMRFYRSHDGGVSWSGGAAGPFVDWTATAADPRSNGAPGRVYVFGNVIFADRAFHQNNADLGGKVLLVSADGGRSFSAPVHPRSPQGVRDAGGFPLAATVLRNGTLAALYARYGTTRLVPAPDGGGRVPPGLYEVLVSADSGRTFGPPRAVTLPDTMLPWPALAGGMAVDQSAGPYDGRLYVTVPTIMNHRRVVALLTSDDVGQTWRLRRTISIGPRIPRSRVAGTVGTRDDLTGIAVNPKGVVGIYWYDAVQGCPRFAVSRDGGQTLSRPVTLARCDAAGPTRASYYEYGLQGVSQYESDEPRAPSSSDKGFSIRVVPVAGLETVQLAADANGRFHPMWVARRADGVPRLWTTTVTVDSDPSPPELAADSLADVSAALGLEIIGQDYDAATKTLAVDVRIENSGTVALRAPMRLELLKLSSSWGDVAVIDADNGRDGPGAIWDLTKSIPGGTLPPGGSTRPYRLVFRVPALNDQPRFHLLASRLRLWAAASHEGARVDPR